MMAIKQCALPTEVSPEQLLGRYEGLLSLSTRINELARIGNWVELIEQESEYVIESEQLSRVEIPVLTADHYERKADLLERIFSLDLETRSLLIARREQLRRQITELGQRNNNEQPSAEEAEPAPDMQ
jgi:hypothetical protein